MEKDKLIKLIRLANNNPSEGEANAAARKVCRLLAEDDFKAISDTPIRQSNTSRDIVKQWEDAMRYGSPTGRYTGFDWMNRDEAKRRRHAANYGYEHVDQTDEPAVNASKEEWEEFYRKKREKKKQAKKYAGHMWCTSCYNYTTKFNASNATWVCPCGKTHQSEVDRASHV